MRASELDGRMLVPRDLLPTYQNRRSPRRKPYRHRLCFTFVDGTSRVIEPPKAWPVLRWRHCGGIRHAHRSDRLPSCGQVALIVFVSDFGLSFATRIGLAGEHSRL
jgi:hypothetical protein